MQVKIDKILCDLLLFLFKIVFFLDIIQEILYKI